MRPETVFLLTIAGIAAAQTTTSSPSGAAMTTAAAILPSSSGGNCNTLGLGSCVNGPQTSFSSCLAQASSSINAQYACLCQSYASVSNCFDQYCIESQVLPPSTAAAYCSITGDAGDGNPGSTATVTPGVVTGTGAGSGRGSATGVAVSSSTHKAGANGLGAPVAGAAGGALAALVVIFRVFL